MNNHRESVPRGSRLVSLALLSIGSIFLEITLTRLYSTLYFPPYVFAVISLAVLGIGLGAAIATWRASLLDVQKVPLFLTLAGLAVLLVAFISVGTINIRLDLLLITLVAVPYLFIGMALASFFSENHRASSQLYLADLAGGGIGAIGAIPLLNALGPINGLLLAAFSLGLAGLLAGYRPFRYPSAVFCGLTILLTISNLSADWFRLDIADIPREKPIVESLQSGGQILETKWDSFARTDLVSPFDGGPYEMFIDGAAGSVMPPVENNDFLRGDIGLFPFATAQPSRVFIVGPGGGLDVWFGLLAEADDIVAVEVNPASVAMVNDFAVYNGDLFNQPSVRVLIDEGRSVLLREQAEYDLIFLSQVVTLAAERSGYALTENTVYTVEAFREYLAHLGEGGQIALKLYDEPTLTRALITAIAAFRQSGSSDAEAIHHMAAFLDRQVDPPIPLLIIRKKPFSREEALELGAVAQRVGFTPLYLPDVMAQPPLDSVEAGTLTVDEIVERSEINISATTDDRPFFFNFDRGLPSQLRSLLIALAVILLVSIGVLYLSLRGDKTKSTRWSALYFAALGAGFMLIEVSIIQQTRLFLGHPTIAITTVLATILLGGGFGSYLSGRMVGTGSSSIPVWPGGLVALLALLWMLAWPTLSHRYFTNPDPERLFVVIISLLPLSLAMGIPFPMGLRAIGKHGKHHVARAWAINGFMTVAGSTGAVALALIAGFSRALLVGIITYLLSSAAAWIGSEN